MAEMMIRPNQAAGQDLAYTEGRFAGADYPSRCLHLEDAYVVNQPSGMTPLGGTLCSMGSDYVVEVSPDGSGRSWLGGFSLTHTSGAGKAWYLKDRETGDIWSVFHNPVCMNSDEYEVDFSPGQASVCSLKNKIYCELTIATAPDMPCEIWRVKLQNRSARHRTLSFTTYLEPCVGTGLEAKFLKREKTLLLRRSLDAIESGEIVGDLVLFHSSTLTPSRFQTEKSGFIGEERSLANPRHVEDDESLGGDGLTRNAVAGFTVEVEVPIEGEADFGFCFGAAPSAEQALEIVKHFSKPRLVAEAVEASRQQWRDLCSTVYARTQDRVFDALVNTWLPYESYAGWVRERTGSACLDQSRVADMLRSLYPLCAAAPDALRNALFEFVSGMSVSGAYTPDDQSLVMLPPIETLWIVVATAGYVAETGDRSILSEIIPLGDGVLLSLGEHCERAIKMCLNADISETGAKSRALIEYTLRQWALISDGARALTVPLRQIKNRKLSERTEHLERRSLPRRARYFQSISPALADTSVSDDLVVRLGSPEEPLSDTGMACGIRDYHIADVFVHQSAGLPVPNRLHGKHPVQLLQFNARGQLRGDISDFVGSWFKSSYPLHRLRRGRSVDLGSVDDLRAAVGGDRPDRGLESGTRTSDDASGKRDHRVVFVAIVPTLPRQPHHIALFEILRRGELDAARHHGGHDPDLVRVWYFFYVLWWHRHAHARELLGQVLQPFLSGRVSGEYLRRLASAFGLGPLDLPHRKQDSRRVLSGLLSQFDAHLIRLALVPP